MKRDEATRSRWPRILVVFLSAMLLLTLFSRAADSIMLPVVQCARPLPGALKHTALISGVIEAREQLPVMSIPELAIERIHVREGQSIKAGDTLLSYDSEALAETLAAAERALKQLQTEREKAAGSKTGTPVETGVRTAELALARADEDLQAKTEDQDRAVQLAEADVLEAKLALDRALSGSEMAFAEAYKALMKEKREAYLAAGKEMYEARVKMEWAWGSLADKSKKKYKELQAAVDRASTRNDNAQVALVDAQLAAHRASDGGDTNKAESILEDAEAEAKSAATALDKAQIKRDRIPGARDYTTARLALEAVQIKYDKAKQEWDDADSRADSAIREVEQACEGKQSVVETAQARLAEKQKAQENAELARDGALREQKRVLEDTEAALAEEQRALRELVLDVQLKDESIAEKQNEVDALHQAVTIGGAVNAPVDGTITELKVKPGDTVTGAAIRLSPSSAGLVVRAAVTEEQAKYLMLGMEAQFQRSGDARPSQGAALLKGLSATPSGYEASFDLPDGAGGIGQAINITATQNTETYPMTVPLGATVENGGIKGVYRVRTGQSVLGDMEYAEFVPVSIIEQDSQNAAIESSLSDQDQVIVTRSKPLSAGDRVRSAS